MAEEDMSLIIVYRKLELGEERPDRRSTTGGKMGWMYLI
jgi:hypothetical protein